MAVGDMNIPESFHKADLTKITLKGLEGEGRISLKDIQKIFEKEIQREANELREDVDRGAVPKDEFQKAYAEKKELIKNYVVENLAASMSTSIITEIMETFESKFDRMGKYSRMKGSQVGKQFGTYFVEGEWFGLPEGNRPTEDIEKIELEIKGKISKKSAMKVGDITVSGLESWEAVTDTEKNLIILYKMAKKMRNLLLIRGNRLSEKGSRYLRIEYEEISLHMRLLLYKLWESKFGDYVSHAFADATSITKNGDISEDGTGLYTVTLNVKKINETYRWAELYLYHYDLYSRIKQDDATRRDFFNRLFKKKTDWKFQNLKESPGFGITINYD